MEPIRRPSARQRVANMSNVLAELQSSRSIFFYQSLTQSGISTPNTAQPANLTLPPRFVQDNGDKIHRRVKLSPYTSRGKSSRPWDVRLNIVVRSREDVHVEFADGWNDFAAGNHLEEGDSLIFLLKEGSRSEFHVYMFRGPGASPYFPDVGDSSSNDEDDDYEEANEPISADGSDVGDSSSDDGDDDNDDDYEEGEEDEPISDDSEEDIINQPFFRSSVHHQDEHCGEVIPGFLKRLAASNIQRPDRPDHLSDSAQFQFPFSFAETYGVHFQPRVRLQGVYEDSPVYGMTCRQSIQKLDGHLKIWFRVTEWSKFVRDNDLKVGQKLQFSLTADSYFKVRIVV